jgi:vacuolar-type H+-ATPase subunit F/Vma7
MIDILILTEKIIKQIRQLIQFFEAEQETTIAEIESNVWKVILEIGRLIGNRKINWK